MLREIRDGLDDATAAYLDDGLSRADAERAAVAEFGSPVQVAASIRAELTVAAGRVAALVFSVVSGGQMVVAEMIWSSDEPAAGLPQGAAWIETLSWVVDVAAFAALVVGLAMAALLGSSPRMFRLVRRIDRVEAARRAAIAIVAVVVLQIAAGIVLGLYWLGADALLFPSPLEMLYSPTLPIVEILLAAKCLQLSSRRGWPLRQDGADDSAERLPLMSA